MIKGVTHEKVTRQYAVAGEGPVDRTYGPTKIVAELLTIEWQRDADHGWRVEHIKVSGLRAKADGTAGAQLAEQGWHAWYSDGRPDSWSGDVEPPLWATLVAANDCPEGGPLGPLPTDVAVVDLDQVR